MTGEKSEETDEAEPGRLVCFKRKRKNQVSGKLAGVRVGRGEAEGPPTVTLELVPGLSFLAGSCC